MSFNVLFKRCPMCKSPLAYGGPSCKTKLFPSDEREDCCQRYNSVVVRGIKCGSRFAAFARIGNNVFGKFKVCSSTLGVLLRRVENAARAPRENPNSAIDSTTVGHFSTFGDGQRLQTTAKARGPQISAVWLHHPNDTLTIVPSLGHPIAFSIQGRLYLFNQFIPK